MFSKSSLHREKLNAFFVWLHENSVSATEVVLIDLPSYKGFYVYDTTPQRKELFKKLKKHEYSLKETFRILSHGVLEEKNDWICIFKTPEFEIFEHKKRLLLSEIPPLRWGLNRYEKKIALAFARNTLQAFLGDCQNLQEV